VRLPIALAALLVLTGCSGNTNGAVAPEGLSAAAPDRMVAPRLVAGPAMALPRGETFHQRHPAVAYDPAGKTYLIAWQDGFSGEGGKSRVLARRIGANGAPLDAKPFRVCPTESLQDSPAVAFCAGRFLVAWSDVRNGTDYDVYAAIANLDGAVSPKEAFLLAGGNGGQLRPAIATDGKDQFLVAWQAFVDDHYEIRGARIAAKSGEVLDRAGFAVMERGESPLPVWNGTNYAVFNKWYGAVVGADGKMVAPVRQLWNSKTVGWPGAAAAWGRAFDFFCTEPWPDPWGWGGGGAIIGVSLTPDGESPEREMSPELGRLQAAKADGRVRNCLDATRWRNHPGWPMGMRGGLKGTDGDTWLSGTPAAAFNGRSLVCVWPRAHLIDNRRLTNRDLVLSRVGPDWGQVDWPPVVVPAAAGPTEEANPALCAGPEGQVLLAWECVEERGVGVRYCIITEGPDQAPPRLLYVVPQSDTELVAAFDEPLDAASVGATGAFKIEGLTVKSAALNADGRAHCREAVLTVDGLARGKRYTLAAAGIKDRFGNVTAGEPFEFLAKPGAFLRGDFIDRWAIVGPFPRDLKSHPFDPATVRPTPGAVVKTAAGEVKWLAAKGAVLQFDEIYGEEGNTMAYAGVWVHADAPRKAVLRLDSNDHNRAWVNGKPVFDCLTAAKGSRGFHDYRDEIKVELVAGWNRLLVQVDNLTGTWVMVGQLVDERGQPIRDVTWQAEDPGE